MAGSKRITTFFSKIWLTILIHRAQGFVLEGIIKKKPNNELPGLKQGENHFL